MSAEFEWVAPGEIITNITARVRVPSDGEDGFQLSTNAEEGSVGSSELTLDDAVGDFFPVGLNSLRVRDNASEADDPYVYFGAFGERRERRGPYRTGASRQIFAQLQDSNSGLSRYIVRADEDGARPQETEAERMEWLFTTSGMELHWDIATSILDTGSTVLTAADLTDYTPQQVLDDMAQQTGKNYYVYIDGSVDPPEALLVYGHDSGTHLTSDLRFSNVLADVDHSTTFEAGDDWELTHDPARLASNVTVRYANGRVNENDDETAAEFSRVDKVMDANLIKTAGVATVRALRYLDELDTEERVLSGTVYLPAAKASQFRAGMRCEMKASHLTGMSDFVWVRLLNVTITHISEGDDITYALAFEGNIGATGGGGDAPAFVGLGDGVHSLETASPEPHASTVEGDYMLLFIGNRGSDDPIDSTPLTSDGWAELADSPQTIDINGDDQSARLTVYYKRHTGTQGTITVGSESTPSTVQARILSLRGVEPESGEATHTSIGATEGLDTSIAIPGDTTTEDNAFVVGLCMTMAQLGTPVITGWANADLDDFFIEQYSASSDDQIIAIAWGVKTNAGAFGPTTATSDQSVPKALMTVSFLS